ncbi:MAG: hypothetical protein IJW26_03215 [Clostridia bacterium]|nr:hypothetical protein [Clostridia bacterium]
MRLIVFKSREYLGVFNSGNYCPVTAKNISDLTKNAVLEVYRHCAFYEKKVPKDSDAVEIVKSTTIKSENEIFRGENFSFVTKKDFENLTNYVYQTAFTLKITCEQFENVKLEDIFSFDKDTSIDSDEQIMSLTCKIIEKCNGLSLQDGYALLCKTYYFLTCYAKKFYYDKKEKGENISNLFYFGV